MRSFTCIDIMNTGDENVAQERLGNALLSLRISKEGSRIGDMTLGIHPAPESPNLPGDKKISDFVTLTHRSARPLIIRSPLGGGNYPALYAALHDHMRALSPAFKKASSSIPRKSRIIPSTPYDSTFPIEDTNIALPCDDNPREAQLVIRKENHTIRMYLQNLNGYPAHNGYNPNWKIYRSPEIILPDDRALSKTWEKITSAALFERHRPRANQERFSALATPFDAALAENPNLNLG